MNKDELFKILSSPTKRQLIKLINPWNDPVDPWISTGEIGEEMNRVDYSYAYSSLSRHLNELVGAGLLERMKEGRVVYYRATDRLFTVARALGIISKIAVTGRSSPFLPD